MNNEIGIFQVPASITKISTMAHSLRLVIDTQENLNDDSKARLFEQYNKLGWFTFSVHQIEAENLIDLPQLKSDAKKTQSQRLRAIIFLLWQKDPHGYESFENYYNWYMDKLIDKLKEKLD